MSGINSTTNLHAGASGASNADMSKETGAALNRISAMQSPNESGAARRQLFFPSRALCRRLPRREKATFRALFFLLAILLVPLLLSRGTAADDKKPEAAKGPPKVLLAMPLGVARGSNTTLILRGKGLADATDVRVDIHGTAISAKIKSKGKADLPKPELAEKMGDTQVEIELQIPADAAGDEAKLTVVAPNGESEPRMLRLYNAADLTAEKEPNGGFNNAQPIDAPTTIAGSIEKENDVDVFRVSAKAGQKLSAEVFAARLGSPLDSLLTLYDDKGHVIAQNDDADGAKGDSALSINLPGDGTFYIGLTDAQGFGGQAYAYLLHVEFK